VAGSPIAAKIGQQEPHGLPGRGASYPVSDKTAREEHP
jgi:hypothetical protein